MYIPDIKNDIEFKEELISLKKYFNNIMKKGTVGNGLVEAYKPLLSICHIVLNNNPYSGKQEDFLTIWPIKEYQDGIDFLASPEGKRFIDVLHYFASHYKIPDGQKGG
jgi:hypothetical protein